MNRTLMRTQALYGEMGASEKKVADFLLAHPDEVPPFSIRDFAKVSGSSEATIVRFSRRLGFSGFGELKLALAGESKKDIINPYITPQDDSFAIFEKICSDAYLSLERTKNTLSSDALQKAVEAVAKAGKTVFIGLGSSASVAGDAANQLLRAGGNAISYSDTHMQMVAASRLQKGDVLVGVSQSGASKDIVDAIRVASERGAVTVAVTAKERSPIARASDILLLTDTDEVRHFSQGFSSHLARRLVLDALICSIIQRNETRMAEDLEETELSLLSKRIAESNT